MKNHHLILSMWLCMSLGLSLFGGCSADGPGSGRSCADDGDCVFGSICLSSGSCGTASCDFCEGDQVCITLDGTPTCSVPQCTQRSECGFGERCDDGLCVQNACGEDGSCPEGEVCDELADECIAECVDDAACGSGRICDVRTKLCQAGCRENEDCRTGERCGDGNVCELFLPTSCADVLCEDDERCEDDTLECVLKCVDAPDQPGSCGEGERCDMQTNECTSINCPGQTSAQCDGNASAPIWRDDLCLCVECERSSDCAVGEQCGVDTGRCLPCDSPCEAGTPGTCGGLTPYCSNTCCVACLSAQDCPVDKACVEGRCAEPFACDPRDEGACPSGHVCEGGACVPGEEDVACAGISPDACAAGQFCNPFSEKCEDLGAGTCGLCDNDCTCGGGLTCDGFLCNGCTVGFDPNCAQNLCTMFSGQTVCQE